MRPSPASALTHDAGKVSEPWVSVERVAAHLGVRKDSVYRWIERRGLPAQKIGKLWKLKLSEVDAWVRTQGPHEGDEALAVPGDTRREVPAKARRSAGLAGSILVIDDDETVRETLRDFLSDEGYASVLAADGSQALELLRSGRPRPSLIILDLGMPNMDGWQFRACQMRDPALAEIPVIVATADRGALVAGAAAVLRKPLDLRHLASAVERSLSGRQ